MMVHEIFRRRTFNSMANDFSKFQDFGKVIGLNQLHLHFENSVLGCNLLTVKNDIKPELNQTGK